MCVDVNEKLWYFLKRVKMTVIGWCIVADRLENSRYTLRLPYLVLAFLYLLDALATYLFLGVGAEEWNPLMNSVLSGYGIGGIVFFKLLALLFFGALIFNRSLRLWVGKAIWILNGVLFCIVGLTIWMWRNAP